MGRKRHKSEEIVAKSRQVDMLTSQGERRGLLHVEIEIRQDLIEDASGQRAWATRFAAWLPQALQGLAKNIEWPFLLDHHA